MDFLDDQTTDLGLPLITDVNRDLFSNEVDKLGAEPSMEESFNVDDFLIKNNFQFMPLEELIKDLSDLSQDMIQALLEKVTSKYQDYLKFCQPYMNHDNESALELQKTRTDVGKFTAQLDGLAHRDLQRTKEVIGDAVDYLRKLDEISRQLHDESQMPEIIVLAKELSRNLHLMCGTDPLEQDLCTELTNHLHTLVVKICKMLEGLSTIDSPYVHQLRNEYHGLLQEFQISLKILTDRCLQDPEELQHLSKALISTLPP